VGVLVLEVTYDSAAGLAADFQSQLAIGGLFAAVEVPDGLPPFAPLMLRLVVDGADPIEAEARLTAASPGSLCLEVVPEAREQLTLAVAAICMQLGADGPATRRSAVLIAPGDTVKTAPVVDLPDTVKTAAVPLVAMTIERKLAGMSVSEKVQMALHGTREERTLLMKERAGVVQASLVRNPKCTLDEITALARSSVLAPEAAEALAQHPSYGSSPQIALALARNPRTPISTAVELVDKLSPNDLRMLAKGLGVRMQIAQRARKKLFDEPR
jgi:hypothetical protein